MRTPVKPETLLNCRIEACRHLFHFWVLKAMLIFLEYITWGFMNHGPSLLIQKQCPWLPHSATAVCQPGYPHNFQSLQTKLLHPTSSTWPMEFFFPFICNYPVNLPQVMGQQSLSSSDHASSTEILSVGLIRSLKYFFHHSTTSSVEVWGIPYSL